MTKISLPTNFIKHTSKNPIQKFLINNFYSSLISIIKDLSPNTILDAGCGEGFTMNKLSKNGIGKEIEGIAVYQDGRAIELDSNTFITINYDLSGYNL